MSFYVALFIMTFSLRGDLFDICYNRPVKFHAFQVMQPLYHIHLFSGNFITMPKTMSINLLNNVNSPLKLNSPINIYVENSCSKSVLNKQPMMEYWGYTM